MQLHPHTKMRTEVANLLLCAALWQTPRCKSYYARSGLVVSSAALPSVSPEFADACMSQFEVLSETLPLARAAVFVQSEDTESGALEFFPVAVWPKVQPVFLVGEKTPAERALPKFSLPGGQDATSLLPSYPFLSPTGADGAPISTPLPDGGLSVPLAYKSDTFGVLALWRDGRRATPALSSRPGSDSAVMWSELERRQAERVARTLAVAAALDRATSAAAPQAGASRPRRRQRRGGTGATSVTARRSWNSAASAATDAATACATRGYRERGFR